MGNKFKRNKQAGVGTTGAKRTRGCERGHSSDAGKKSERKRRQRMTDFQAWPKGEDRDPVWRKLEEIERGNAASDWGFFIGWVAKYGYEDAVAVLERMSESIRARVEESQRKGRGPFEVAQDAMLERIAALAEEMRREKGSQWGDAMLKFLTAEMEEDEREERRLRMI